VRLLVVQQFGESAYTRGLNVVVTVNSQDQLVAFRALRRGVMDFEMRQIYRGPEAHVALSKDAAQAETKIIEALEDHPDDDELLAGVVLEATPTRVLVMRSNGEKVTITGNGLKPVQSGLAANAPAQKQIRRGSVVHLFPIGKGALALTHSPEVEGAFVAVEPNTGNIRAMVGGFDFGKNKFNHVVQAWRQPGSSFKPFIYSAALEKGFTPTSVIADTPLFFDAAQTGGQPWEPKNYDGTFDGPMSLRRGLARSKNMVSIRVLDRIGTSYAQQWVTKFGFEPERHPAVLTLALGAGTVTPLQMATATGVFATGGHYVPPRLIARVLDRQGRVVSEPDPIALNESNRVISARNAFVMTSLLGEVTQSGTAANASRVLKRKDIYGKTGTTNDSLDAWFAGWHPNITAVVWMGYDTPRKLGDRETGGGLALPVWIEFMQHALKSTPIKPMPPPPAGLVSVGQEQVFQEFAGGAGIDMVGVEEEPPEPPSESERNSILDLFRR
jgi:penicillin-binding protein 1A